MSERLSRGRTELEEVEPVHFHVAFAGIVLLTLVTLALSFVRLGAWEAPVALGIAGIKAALVALFFMHLAEQRFGNRAAFGVGVAFFVLLVSLSTVDVETREPPPMRPPTGALP